MASVVFDKLERVAQPKSLRNRAEKRWMSSEPLRPHQPYLLKHTTRLVQARVREIRHTVDVNTLAHRATPELRLNDIGVVSIEAQQPICFDPYRRNRATGAFVLVDPLTNGTVAAGMIHSVDRRKRLDGPVTAAERQLRCGHPPLAVHLVDCDAEIAWMLERRLFEHGCAVLLLPEGLASHPLLEAAGIIAITTGPEAPAGAVVLNGLTLPENSEAAVEHIFHQLQPRLQEWGSPLTGGDGI